jgi:hypothetical protein
MNKLLNNLAIFEQGYRFSPTKTSVVEFLLFKIWRRLPSPRKIAILRFGEPEGPRQRKSFREKFNSRKYNNPFLVE